MRIKAVSNIQKITQSMKMVAAAKLNQVKDKSAEAVSFTASNVDFLKKEFTEEETGEKRVHLLVPITGDKGLCGSVNSNVVRFLKRHIVENPNDDYKILCVGQKGADGMKGLHGKDIQVTPSRAPRPAPSRVLQRDWRADWRRAHDGEALVCLLLMDATAPFQK